MDIGLQVAEGSLSPCSPHRFRRCCLACEQVQWVWPNHCKEPSLSPPSAPVGLALFQLVDIRRKELGELWNGLW